MNKYIKSNLFVISIIVFLGLITMLFNTLNYIERRIFGITISIIEVSIVFILSKRQNLSLKDMGIIKPIKPIAWILGIIVALIPMFLMIVLNCGNLDTMFPPKTSLTICITQTIYYFLIVAPSEEIIFRGFLLENFNKNYNENISILLTSFVFALVHVYNGSIMNVVIAFVISLLYCKVKFNSNNRSIFPCMFGHAINDSLNQWIPYFIL